MPRVTDTGRNGELSRPNFYSFDQENEYLEKRLEEYIYEPALPPIPTREQELKYLDELEKDFKNDRWTSVHFRSMQAGPQRRPFKRFEMLRNQYRFKFFKDVLIGAILVSPIAIMFGKMSRLNFNGIPRIYYPWNFKNFQNTHFDNHGMWYFKFAFYSTLYGGAL